VTVLNQSPPLTGADLTADGVQTWDHEELVHCIVQTSHWLQSCCDTLNSKVFIDADGSYEAWKDAAMQAGRDLEVMREEALRRMRRDCL